MQKILISFLVVALTNFYTLQFTRSDGSVVNMASYQGKKILLVNIATGSSEVGQLAALQTLQTQYADSLVVLAFPSNSFGHEARTNPQIAAFCATNYQTTFVIASKGAVRGDSIQPLYNWLSKMSENGTGDTQVEGDFHKYLISSSGELIGVYSAKVSPMDTVITHAVMRDL